MTWALLLALAVAGDPAPRAAALSPLWPSSRFAPVAVPASRPPAAAAALSPSVASPSALVPLALAWPPPAPPVADGWFARDKWMHFAATAVIHGVFYGVALGSNTHAASQRIGGAAVTVIGLGREVYDWRVKDRFSSKDLVWDALGGVAAAVAVHQVR